MMLRMVSGPAAAQPPRRHSSAGSKLGWRHQELKQCVVSGNQRAAFLRHHAQRSAGLERRQRDEAGAGDQRDQERERRAGDVEERPAVEVAVVRRDPHPLADRPGVAQHVVVREHHCFRIGGGARCELNQQQVARPHLRGEAIECVIRHSARERQECVEADRRLRNLASNHDDTVQQRQGAAGKRLVNGGLGGAQKRKEIDVQETVGSEQHLHVGLREAEGEFRRLEAGVDRHGDRADGCRGVEQRHPGLVVAHENADEIAAPHPERVHGLGGAPHCGVLVVIGEARGRGHQRLRVAPGLGALGHERVERFRRPAHVEPCDVAPLKPAMRVRHVSPCESCARFSSIASSSTASAPRGSSSLP